MHLVSSLAPGHAGGRGFGPVGRAIRFVDRAQAELSVFEFIEGFYNTRRRHSALGYLAPLVFEQKTDTSLSSGSLKGCHPLLGRNICDPPFLLQPYLPSTSLAASSDSTLFAPNPTNAVGGWMYLNLENADLDPQAASQNWVIVSMRAEGRYSVDFDALALGNGCTAPTGASAININGGVAVIGPAPNVNP
jgi:hypothetical protein